MAQQSFEREDALDTDAFNLAVWVDCGERRNQSALSP